MVENSDYSWVTGLMSELEQQGAGAKQQGTPSWYKELPETTTWYNLIKSFYDYYCHFIDLGRSHEEAVQSAYELSIDNPNFDYVSKHPEYKIPKGGTPERSIEIIQWKKANKIPDNVSISDIAGIAALSGRDVWSLPLEQLGPLLNSLKTNIMPTSGAGSTGGGTTDGTGDYSGGFTINGKPATNDEYLAWLMGQGGEPETPPEVKMIGGRAYYWDTANAQYVPVSTAETPEEQRARELALLQYQQQAQMEQLAHQKQAELEAIYATDPYKYWAQVRGGVPTKEGEAPALEPGAGTVPGATTAPTTNWLAGLETGGQAAPTAVSGLATEKGLTTPSMQYWNKLSPSEQKTLLGTANWLGISPEDWEFYRTRKAAPAARTGALSWAGRYY